MVDWLETCIHPSIITAATAFSRHWGLWLMQKHTTTCKWHLGSINNVEAKPMRTHRQVQGPGVKPGHACHLMTVLTTALHWRPQSSKKISTCKSIVQRWTHSEKWNNCIRKFLTLWQVLCKGPGVRVWLSATLIAAAAPPPPEDYQLI